MMAEKYTQSSKRYNQIGVLFTEANWKICIKVQEDKDCMIGAMKPVQTEMLKVL